MKKISIVLLAVFFIGIANVNAQTDATTVTTETVLGMEEVKEVKTCSKTGKVCDETCEKKKNGTCCKGEKKKSCSKSKSKCSKSEKPSCSKSKAKCSKSKSSCSKSKEGSFNFDKSNDYEGEKSSCSKKSKKGCSKSKASCSKAEKKKGCCKKDAKSCGEDCTKPCCAAPPTPPVPSEK